MSVVATRAAGSAPAHLFSAARSPFDSPVVLVGLFLLALALFYDPREIGDVLFRLHLPDTDDAMRLVDVRALVAGQAWYDVHQYRFLPPGGASMHWSRLVDAPITGLILALTPLLGQRMAEGVTAVAWPMITFAVYGTILFLAVRKAFGSRPAWLALFVACQTGGIVGLFAFGRIDHHNVQLCTILGAAACLALPGSTLGQGIAAGLLAALSLAVGLETLPSIAGLGLVLALLWIVSGEQEGAPLTGFGLALALGAPLLLAAQTAPSLWGVPACDALSTPWLWLTTGAGAAGLLPYARLGSPRARLLAGGVLGAGIVAGFAALFPSCLAGPFAHLPPVVVDGWVHQVTEAKSVWAHLRANVPSALSSAMPIVIATLVAAVLAWRLRGEARGRLHLFAAAMLGVGTLIIQFQIRGIYISSAFVPLVAGFVLDRALAALRDPAAGPRRQWLLLALSLLLIGKVWAAITTLPKAITDTATKGEVVEDPTIAAFRTCTGPKTLAALDALPLGLVLAPIDLGPAILLHTKHSVVAAPYHRAGDGLLAGLESFDGSEADMRGHAARLKADYVVICPSMQGEPPGRPLPFATRLARGEAAPSWLEPAPLPVEAGPLKANTLKAWRARP